MENEANNELVKKKKKPLKVVSDILYFTVIAVLVLSILGVLVNSVLSDGKRLSSICGYTPTIIVSESMVPTIEVNALCFIKNVDFDEIQEGDIIVYIHPEDGRNIVHRVNEIDTSSGRTKFIMKGDNNPTIDRFTVTESMYNGKVVAILNWTAKYLGKCISDYGIDYTELAKYTVKGLAIVFAFIYVLYIVIYLITHWLVQDIIKKHRRNKNGL